MEGAGTPELPTAGADKLSPATIARLKTAAVRLRKAERPVRVLRAVAWGPEVAERFFAAGEKELLRAIVALGGDVDVDALAAGRGLYRFRDLEAEVEELKKQREQASDEEKAVGAVVFVS